MVSYVLGIKARALCMLSVPSSELRHIPVVHRFPAWGQDCPVVYVFVFQDEALPLSSYEFPMKKVLRQGWSYTREHQEGFGKSGRVCDGQVNTAGVVQFLNLQGTHRSPVLFIPRTFE